VPPIADVTAELLLDDATLAAEHVPHPVTARGRDVFLTGASGFVGTELLRRILEHTAARVYCHVRARSTVDAHRRLLDGLRAIGELPPAWAARVVPVLGDLSRPRLGIATRQWDELAADIGEIFHVAALVNHVAPYRLFRRPNVHAIDEVLRLSATTAQKRIHHISSMGYWSGYHGPADAGARHLAGPGPDAPGYTLSKWASDRLMEQAADRGFPVAIYRLGYVGGGWHGASNLRGWLELHLRGFARLRKMPVGETRIAVTPVDLLASDVWALATRPDAFGRAYNLAHREQVISMTDIEAAFAAIGWPVRRTSGAAWMAAFQAAPHDPYMELLHVFLEDEPPRWDAERHAFDLRVAAATHARLGSPPAFSKPQYLQAMLSGLIRSEHTLRVA
jgi:thioester reductase-like protein